MTLLSLAVLSFSAYDTWGTRDALDHPETKE
jgi:hypothetical protein